MKIEIGKRYVYRDGSISGFMEPYPYPINKGGWVADPSLGYLFAYGTNGHPSDALVSPNGGPNRKDIVEEYKE